MEKEPENKEDQESLYELEKIGKPFFFPIGIPLQIEIKGISFKMKSVSVGCLPDSCLILTYPSTPMSISRGLFKGNRVIVRYLDGGNVFAFESELVCAAYEPVRLLYVSYPSH